jgi:hypothetical protein
MTIDTSAIGTVASDADTPTFELVRIKLKAGKDVSPDYPSSHPRYQE